MHVELHSGAFKEIEHTNVSIFSFQPSSSITAILLVVLSSWCCCTPAERSKESVPNTVLSLYVITLKVSEMSKLSVLCGLFQYRSNTLLKVGQTISGPVPVNDTQTTVHLIVT